MVFDEKIKTAFDVLRNAAENDFERHRIDVLERDLTSPPVPEQIDEKHQRFDGVTYYQNSEGHYTHNFGIHVAIWRYYHGDIPSDGARYEVHHRDLDKDNNAIDNLELLTCAEHRRIHNLLDPTCLHPEHFKITCIQCGKIVDSASRKRLFCSKKCKTDYYKVAKYETLTCPVCGKEFRGLKKAHRIYCSNTCSNRSHHKAFHPITGEPTSHVYELRKCEVCGKEFPTTRHRPARACSPACRVKLTWETRRRNANNRAAEISTEEEKEANAQDCTDKRSC